MRRRLLKSTTAFVLVSSLLNPLAPVLAATGSTGLTTGPYNEPTLTSATAAGTVGATTAPTTPSTQGNLTLAQKVAALQSKVKYVFVLFQENRAFDHYFGTYPGANGLLSTYPGANGADPFALPANQTKSFNSVIANDAADVKATGASYSVVHPFLIPRAIQNVNGVTTQLYPEDTYSVSHAHGTYVVDFHFADPSTKATTQNDAYALGQQGLQYADARSCTPATDPTCMTTAAVLTTGTPPAVPTAPVSLSTKQKGEVALSHIDCDTIPFLWQLADRFTLFDNFHQTATGPSTPNAIALIGGQVGDTQWVKHGPNGAGTAFAQGLSVPNLTDTAPFPGSSSDTSPVKPPYGPDESTNPNVDTTGNFAANGYLPQVPLTFASLPLSFAGSQVGTVIRSDEQRATDLADVAHDIATIGVRNPAVNWGWYQQGYGPEPFDGTSISENGGGIAFTAAPQHASYVVHHNGPQYFGYVGDNPVMASHLHGLQQFYTDVSNQALPTGGGVFYVRGGYYNNDGMKPADPNATVQASTPGNDDHPNYSDAGISEASIADSVNAIANSPYWSQCAIIITYDETDGLYDHQSEQFRTYGPDGLPETGGPRIPTILISPYAASHAVSHVYSEHSSVIQLIDMLFGLVPLADLPDEANTRAAAAANPSFNAPNGSPQLNLGPADDPAAIPSYAAGMGNMLEAFDNDRLLGNKAPLPASYALIAGGPANGITLTGSNVITSLPHYQGTNGTSATFGCQYLGISPTDYTNGYVSGGETDTPPLDFNPRPTQSPGNPYLNTNGSGVTPWGG